MQTFIQLIPSEEILLPVHIVILLFIFWNIFKADHSALSWIRGKVNILDSVKMKKLHDNVFYGLIGMTITGIGLYLLLQEKLSASPAFKIKMALVGVLFINSLIIYKLMPTASEKKYSELSTKEKLPLILSGVVSTLSWIGVLIAVTFLPE